MHTLFARLALAAIILLLFSAPATAEPPVQIIVYAATEPEILERYSTAFHQANEDILVTWVTDDGGSIIARLLAEKNAPKASAVFGLPVSGILFLKQNGVLAPYRPEGYEHIAEPMRDNSESPVWTGTSAWVSGLCVNEEMLMQENLPLPVSWKDLTRPEYADKVVMPNPYSSSNGYMTLWGWVHLWGTEQAWEYMKRLDRNVLQYASSGNVTAGLVADGEVPVGVSSPPFAKDYADMGAPLRFVFPDEGSAWDMEASALVRQIEPLSEEERRAAERLMDFASSREAAEIAAEELYIPARLDVEALPQAGDREKMMPMDAEHSARERETILNRWHTMFGKFSQ